MSGSSPNQHRTAVILSIITTLLLAFLTVAWVLAGTPANDLKTIATQVEALITLFTETVSLAQAILGYLLAIVGIGGTAWRFHLTVSPRRKMATGVAIVFFGSLFGLALAEINVVFPNISFVYSESEQITSSAPGQSQHSNPLFWLILPSAVGGAISAFLGAGAYHYVDKLRTRRKLMTGLEADLRTIQTDLENQLDDIKESGTSVPYRYPVEVFETLPPTDPELYVELLAHTEAQSLFVFLKQWNEDQIIISRDKEIDIGDFIDTDTLEEQLEYAEECRRYLADWDNRGIVYRLFVRLWPGIDNTDADT